MCHLCLMLKGIRLFFDEMATDALEAKALSYERDYIDIYSNSWGPDDKGFEVVGPDRLTQLALKDGAEKVKNEMFFTLYKVACFCFFSELGFVNLILIKALRAKS